MQKYTKKILQPIIYKASTWADVCRDLNIKSSTGSQSHIKKVAIKFEIDFSHFLGQAHNKGKVNKKRMTASEYISTSSVISSHKLKNKLIQDGIKKAECENCHLTDWMGEKIPLELDHIDNNHFNNELSNLKILCPNCHAHKTKRVRGQGNQQ